MPEDNFLAFAAAADNTGESDDPILDPVAGAAPEGAAPANTDSTAVPVDGDEDEQKIQADWAELAQKGPEYAAAAKQFQAGLQKLREKDKSKYGKFETYTDIDERELAWLAQIRQVAQTDPVRAGQLLKQHGEYLEAQAQQAAYGQPAPQPAVQSPGTSLADWQPESYEGEQLKAAFMAEVEALKNQVAPMIQTTQQLAYARQEAELNRQFDQIGAKYNDTIDEPRRREIAGFAARNGIANVEHAYQVMNFEKAQKASFAAGQGVIQEKLQTSITPAGTVQHTPSSPGPGKAPSNFLDFAKYQLSQADA